MILIWCVYMV